MPGKPLKGLTVTGHKLGARDIAHGLTRRYIGPDHRASM
jgi:hypothetical protein